MSISYKAEDVIKDMGEEHHVQHETIISTNLVATLIFNLRNSPHVQMVRGVHTPSQACEFDARSEHKYSIIHYVQTFESVSPLPRSPRVFERKRLVEGLVLHAVHMSWVFVPSSFCA